jgi:hypothetical protein
VCKLTVAKQRRKASGLGSKKMRDGSQQQFISHRMKRLPVQVITTANGENNRKMKKNAKNYCSGEA